MYSRFLRLGLVGILVFGTAFLPACSSGTAASGPAGTEQATGGSNGSSGSNNSGGSNSSGGSANAKSSVPLGKACVDDQDCQTGLRCLAPLFDGTERYCSSACTQINDCGGLAATSYAIDVPLMSNQQFGDPFANVWNATVLSRAVGCAPIGGKQGQPSYCQFACPPNAAAALDDKGIPHACGCLPGYQFSADQTTCEKKPAMSGQCTVFSWASTAYRENLTAEYGIELNEPLCDACNSDLSDGDTLHCHTGRFMCALNGPSFNGHCIEEIEIDELSACHNSALYQSCSCDCPTPDACYNDNCACCTCTQTSTPTPRPVCSNGGGGGSGNGGSSAGGASGTAGGGSLGGSGSVGGATGTAGTGSGSAGGPNGSAGTGPAGGATGTAGTGSGSAGGPNGSAGAGFGGTGPASAGGPGSAGAH